MVVKYIKKWLRIIGGILDPSNDIQESFEDLTVLAALRGLIIIVMFILLMVFSSLISFIFKF